MDGSLPQHEFERIERALAFLASHYREQPDLARVAHHVGLSPHHFQRMFTRWVGLSPKRFAGLLTLDHAKRVLAESRSVLDAAFEAGLSGPGRLHDLFVAYDAMTPGEYKSDARDLVVRYGFHDTPFGESLLLATERGVCGLAFVDDGGRNAAFADMNQRWARARLVEEPGYTAPIVRRIFREGRVPPEKPPHLLLKGTNFQIKVWEALIRIPRGFLTSYEDLAERIGAPRAVRAVAGAVAANPVSYLVPCHRVIRKTGEISGYHWGPNRKRAMLAFEMAALAKQPS